MSKVQFNSAIEAAKDKAKHLHSILKKRCSDISLSECYNVYARLEGARDWNTLNAVLNGRPAKEESTQKRIEAFWGETIQPMLTQIASANGLDLSTSDSYFLADKDTDESGIYSPALEVFMELEPKNKKNTFCSFSIKISPRQVYIKKVELIFDFPENLFDFASTVFHSERIPFDLTPSIVRNTEMGKIKNTFILEVGDFSEVTGRALHIWDSAEKIECIRRDLNEMLRKYSRLIIPFQKLSNQWSNKKVQSSFETAIWETFTGKPRYMSASPEFYRASFGEVILTAVIYESGPYIKGPDGSLPFGASSIIYKAADDSGPAGYYIAKYGHNFEADIYLKGIAKEDILKITSEFGIPPDFKLAQELDFSVEDEYVAFYRSKAFRRLNNWISKNRSFAKRIRRHASYIPDWYDRAIGQYPIPDSDRELINQKSLISGKRKTIRVYDLSGPVKTPVPVSGVKGE